MWKQKHVAAETKTRAYGDERGVRIYVVTDIVGASDDTRPLRAG